MKGQRKHPFARLLQACHFFIWLAVLSPIHFGANQGTSNLQDHPNLVLEGVIQINHVLTPHFASLQVIWVS